MNKQLRKKKMITKKVTDPFLKDEEIKIKRPI